MLTPSSMLALGTKAPDFELPDTVSGKQVSLSDLKDKKAFLLMFICRHCPYVAHIKAELTKIGDDYKKEDIAIVAISSNDAQNYPEDAPESLKEFAKEQQFSFPLLYDETQEVARAYTAACTPDFFLFDEERKLVYRGQLDSSRPGNSKKIDGSDLRSAIDAVLTDGPIDPDQKASSGCNIKWK